MKSRKDIERIRQERRRSAIADYYYLFVMFIFMIIVAIFMFLLTITNNDVLSGNIPPGGRLAFCITGVMFYIALLGILPELIRSKRIMSGEEGIRGLEWSKESYFRISFASLCLALTLFFGLGILVYFTQEEVGERYLAVTLIFVCLLGIPTYWMFSEIISLRNYKFKIFENSSKKKTRHIIEEVIRKEGLKYEFLIPHKKFMNLQFDLIIKTDQGFRIRIKKLGESNDYWISMGPRKKENAETIRKLMLEIDRKFSEINDLEE